MPIKITTFRQLELLQEGDVLQKFPSQGTPENKFDKHRSDEIDTYEIKTINRKNQTMHLAINNSMELFAWPGDLQRLNIKTSSILAENRWWIS